MLLCFSTRTCPAGFCVSTWLHICPPNYARTPLIRSLPPWLHACPSGDAPASPVTHRPPSVLANIPAPFSRGLHTCSPGFEVLRSSAVQRDIAAGGLLDVSDELVLQGWDGMGWDGMKWNEISTVYHVRHQLFPLHIYTDKIYILLLCPLPV